MFAFLSYYSLVKKKKEISGFSLNSGLFPRAPITNYHMVAYNNKHSLTIGWKSEMKVSARPHSFRTSREDPVLPLPASGDCSCSLACE